MKNPLDYYKNHFDIYTEKTQKLTSKITILSLCRLVVFVLTGFGVYMFLSQWEIAVFIAAIGLVVFGVLLSKYTKLKVEKALNEALVKVNEDEIKIASGDFYDREKGLQFQDSNHFYSLDIDLFGSGSFFQFINRTTLKSGTKKLADSLKSNTINQIVSRQNAIKELKNKIEWRQLYTATSSLVTVTTPEKDIVNWLANYKACLPKIMRWFPLLYTIISLLIIGLTFLKIIPNTQFIGYWLLIGLAVTGMYLKKINNLAVKTNKVKELFKQYALLLNLIEKTHFSSELLQQKQKKIELGNEKASVVFKTFSKSLEALDNRNNLIGAIFGNGYFLTDIKNSYKIEQWIKKYGNKVACWFEVIAFFDAYNTLGNYAYNHPNFVFPKINNNQTVIKSKNLGHPLLKKIKRIDSDVTIENEQFFIVTGANMAGKSTFLRTISLHIVMANVGLPVCATSSEYSPVKLITSMRTTDSLVEDSSYFFSELTRLKYIVDAIQKESYFIVLDEILKGTNSTDKAIGSRKFVEKLVASNATGIIATHDLSLCEIEKELPDVKNYYFDAEIINDELHFDYTLKQGICKNMNASFLLKKMNII